MRKILTLAAAVAAVFAMGTAQAALILVDDFNGPDMFVFDPVVGGGGVSVGPVGPVNNGDLPPLSRTVTHELLTGTNLLPFPGFGSSVLIGSASNPGGSLNIANGPTRDSQVQIAWTLPVNFLSDPGPASFLFNVILSDANQTAVELFFGATSLGLFNIPGNSTNLPLAFNVSAANKALINGGGILRMVIDGEDGWDLALDSFGFQVPEPTTLALVGLALLGAGVVSRRRKA